MSPPMVCGGLPVRVWFQILSQSSGAFAEKKTSSTNIKRDLQLDGQTQPL